MNISIVTFMVRVWAEVSVTTRARVRVRIRVTG